MTSLEAALHGAAPTLREEALHAAVSAWESMESRGEAIRPFLTVIDYSLPSTARRMWVFDLASHKLLFNELVAHGRNSGENMAESFSNEDGSLMTSLGAFVTGASYSPRPLRGRVGSAKVRIAQRTVPHEGTGCGQDHKHPAGTDTARPVPARPVPRGQSPHDRSYSLPPSRSS